VTARESPRDVLQALTQRLFKSLDARGHRGADYLLAADGQFLGNLNANRYDRDSIANLYGPYGSRYSPLSIFNPYGRYGGRYSDLSPFNPYTNTPPSIHIDGKFAGYLTVNPYLAGAVAPEDLVVKKLGLQLPHH
jgi:hypothetical protein